MSRIDSIGLFWEDVPTKAGRNFYARPMPSIPETGWKAPRVFPNLSQADCICFDVETYDPGIGDNMGPGWARGVGHIVGVAVGVPGGGRWYFPIRHETMPEDNLDPEHVFAWLRDTLSNPAQPKLGANVLYDVGWLRQEGVHVAGPLVDVQYAEALLCEASPVSLDYLGEKYLGEGKVSGPLYQWLADWQGGSAESDKLRAHIHKSPPCLVGPYAEGDVDLPLRVAAKQYPLLARENLLELFQMECALIPLLVEMRFTGVTVDVKRAEQVADELGIRVKALQKNLDDLCGRQVNVNASQSIADAFDSLGLPYKRTKPTAKKPDGSPSFTKEFMATVDHRAARLIEEIKVCRKMKSTFVESYILDNHVNGKVHGEFHLLKGEGGGTRSGRFSSSHPNLQNIPSRDPVLGPLMRSMFIPHAGHKQWRKYDQSQIEYRLLAHHAVGPGSDHLRDVYSNDPSTDYHELTQKLVQDFTGQHIDRKPIKNINFGLIYGMGVGRLSRSLGLSEEDGRRLFAAYHEAAPFAKATMEECSNEAQATGIITTVLGRRSRFDMWEPFETNYGDRAPALPYHKALMRYGQVKRAMTHKALNRRLQGGAADLMKMAMLRCWRDGVFDRTGVPCLTVHDELDFSDPGTAEADEAFREVRRMLESAVPLRVPVLADYEAGPSWGAVREVV
jgi:DNA polymerase I-like protein with 3'-5' exonuclease and polymerase domains